MANLVLCLAFLFLAFGKVQCRFLRLNSSVLVSDGVANVDHQSPFLSLNGLLSSSAEACQHYYGFFPCANNIGGFLFQIVVYEYLLATGEKFLTKGSKQLFNIIGTGFFGDVFEILMVLPEMMVVLIAGLTENEEDAQSGVSVSVGVYAGSTVFCLTLQWGICVIFGRNSFKPESSTSQDSEHSTSRTSLKEKLSLLNDSGVTTDNKTGYTAGIMLLSLIPFIIVQLSGIINTSSGSRIVVLIALIVSVSGLLAYFLYQILDPWIQERSLEYTKYENLLAGFLNHVQRHTQGRLVTNEGTPNVPVIRSLFAKVDRDGDQTVSISEVEALIADINSGKVGVEKEYAIAEVVQPWIEERRHELVKIERLMSRILKHVQHQAFEADGLVTDDGSPNVDRIKSIFEEFDSNHNKLISQSELKEVIQNIRFGKFQLDHDLVAENVMKDFDEDGDQMISEQEFINGITKWIHKATCIANSKDSKNFIDEFDKIAWKEVDSLVYEKEENRGIIHQLLSRDCIKSVLQIILGAAIVSFLAEPLIYSILDLSTALGLPTFYISFVIIPFALKFKMAVSAIFPASQKSLKTASLTFSEIYGGVVMNNITGLSILLAIVYIKDLTWDYSVEVLVILVVCAIIGLLAFFRSSYPLWTCILAFFLYPFSLLLVHFLHNIVGWE
ncbi:hypothetical protein RHMOL_Rhmol13G0245900 [Rhododendron molle]|uniref:Uncharacterized protein n=1 Tax=Rhododendron molle TaxID=49168 RepID=A0ACC0LAH8_RHOML|nr:hypothetical protein RHMOL_Rhmol13G0245900 [Rhododendron molle]